MGIAEILVGLFAILVGALFAFQGSTLLRILFPFVGFFAGFSAGAAMVTGITGDGFLSSVLSWVVGFCVALLFAVLAYFFYAFAVVLAFAGLGFSLAAAFLGLFNLDWNWLVILVGSATGFFFGVGAIFMRLPIIVLIIVSSFLGASIAMYGLLLIFNSASFGDLSNGMVFSLIRNNSGLYALWLIMGFGATFVQSNIVSDQQKLAEKYWQSSMTFDDLMKQSK